MIEEIEEIIARYQTLRNARNDLMVACEKQNDEILKRRKAYVEMKSTSQNQLLIQSGILNAYRSELENLLNVLKTEQDESEVLEDNKKDVIRAYSQINQAIKNIYSRCQLANNHQNSNNNNNNNATVTVTALKGQSVKLNNTTQTGSTNNLQENHKTINNNNGNTMNATSNSNNNTITTAGTVTVKMTNEAEKEKLLLYLDFIQNKIVDLQEIKNEFHTPENMLKYKDNTYAATLTSAMSGKESSRHNHSTQTSGRGLVTEKSIVSAVSH